MIVVFFVVVFGCCFLAWPVRDRFVKCTYLTQPGLQSPKGCHSKHLLADNLGWSNYVGGFDFDGGEYNIEMYMKNKANEEARKNGGLVEENSDLVMRVNQDVFDLESVLYKGQKDEKNMYAKGKRGEDDDNVGEDVGSWN